MWPRSWGVHNNAPCHTPPPAPGFDPQFLWPRQWEHVETCVGALGQLGTIRTLWHPSRAPHVPGSGCASIKHAKIAFLQDELVYFAKSYMWATFGNMRGFPDEPNFFAVIISPNTRAGAAGVIKTQKSVQKTDKTRRHPEKKRG